MSEFGSMEARNRGGCHEEIGSGRSRRCRAGRFAPIALVLALSMLMAGCLARGGPVAWGAGAAQIGFEDVGSSASEDAGFDTLQPLAGLFYERITNRRFNSKATYDDPALREYFHSVSAFSDYYANVSEALDRAHFEDARPTASRLLRIQRTGPDEALLRVALSGENGLPLRWWRVRIVREDRWEYVDGRWWVVPGKV